MLPEVHRFRILPNPVPRRLRVAFVKRGRTTLHTPLRRVGSEIAANFVKLPKTPPGVRLGSRHLTTFPAISFHVTHRQIARLRLLPEPSKSSLFALSF